MDRRTLRLFIEYVALVVTMAVILMAMMPPAPHAAKLVAPASLCTTDSDCATFCKDQGCDGGPVPADPKGAR